MSPDATPHGAGAAADDASPDGLADAEDPADGAAVGGAAPGEAVSDDASADGAAALVPGGRPDERPVKAPEPPARAARRRRLQALAGMTVHGSDGKTVGRVRDVYQQDAGGELAAITVMPRQLSARSVLIPASAIAALPDAQDRPTPDAGDLARNADQPSSNADQPAPDASSAASEEAPDELRLTVDAATAKAGARPPQTLHATPQDLRDAEAALGLAKEGSVGA